VADAPFELGALAGQQLVEGRVVEVELADHALVVDRLAALGHRADAELGLEGSAELAGDHHVEGGPQPARDLVGHGHATTRQRQDHGLVQLQLRQAVGEPDAGVGAVLVGHRSVAEAHGAHLPSVSPVLQAD
jgi:hypothetical protein